MQREAIETILAPIQGATFASLDTQTQVKLLGGKSNPHQGRVYKRCLGNRVILFTNKRSSGYENMVKRHLALAGLDPATFNAGDLPWGTRVPNSPFIQHNDKLYLQAVFQKTGDVKYFIRDERYANRFSPIDKNEIIGLTNRTGSEGQGLPNDKQVIVRAYDIQSINAIRCFGENGEDLLKEDIGIWNTGE